MRKVEREHLNAVVTIGCILCARLGTPGTPAEIHHLRDGQGMGQRAPHSQTIPLCYAHHRGAIGYHGLGKRAFEAMHGVTERELLSDTRKIMGLD